MQIVVNCCELHIYFRVSMVTRVYHIALVKTFTAEDWADCLCDHMTAGGNAEVSDTLTTYQLPLYTTTTVYEQAELQASAILIVHL